MAKLPSLIVGASALPSGIVELLTSGWESLRLDSQDFGILPALALRLGLFEAKGLVYEVREHFIRGDGGLDQAIAFKDSYTPTFSMVGVAGAIIAQIALTALSLPNLDDTHWTTRAPFVIGLVAGSLAVFCCCVLQSKMSALHTAQAVRGWLTRPRIRSMLEMQDDAISAIRHSVIVNLVSGESRIPAMKQVLSRYDETFNEKSYRPSLSAALIITAPLQLLNIALSSLLTGFGIYFGFVYSALLPTIGDHNSALAVLVVYIASAASGLLLFYLPVLIKHVATMRDQKEGGDVPKFFNKLYSDVQAAERADTASKQNDVLLALTRIANLQDEQLRLQKDFQALLEARFNPSSSHPHSPHPPSSHPPSSHPPSSRPPSSHPPSPHPSGSHSPIL